ncbi:unnamed protein product, partial [Didymodactylos carnosus]
VVFDIEQLDFSIEDIFLTKNGMTERNAQIRATLNTKLIESGEREQMKQILRQRLIEYGWRDQMKSYCKGICQYIADIIPNEKIF